MSNEFPLVIGAVEELPEWLFLEQTVHDNHLCILAIGPQGKVIVALGTAREVVLRDCISKTEAYINASD